MAKRSRRKIHFGLMSLVFLLPVVYGHASQHTGHPQENETRKKGKVNQPQQQHGAHQQKESSAKSGQAAQQEGHAAGHDSESAHRTLSGGPYRSMHAIGSGTSLLPATSPAHMWMWQKNSWSLMWHTDIKAGLNHQSGPRGVNKAESQNMLMMMAERNVGNGRLMLRGMFSAEPWTAPNGGFPQLFQTGETFRGRPIIDAQHPHDLFMELAASYTLPLAEEVSLQFYGGPVAEPALGPSAFMHRPSASENPAAPLSHHLMDSTHIAHGVVTTGVTAGKFKLEASLFHGAEPDENRTTIDLGRLDSWSGRLWFAPGPNWIMQVSHGRLRNPEAADPGDINRTTASISYNRSWSSGNWASSLIWGRNDEEDKDLNGYLLESTVNFADRNYAYTRLELLDRTGLLQDNIFGRSGVTGFPQSGPILEAEGPIFRVAAFTFGGVRDLVANSTFRIGIGADVTLYDVPGSLKALYGNRPTSFHLFLRFRPGKMAGGHP